MPTSTRTSSSTPNVLLGIATPLDTLQVDPTLAGSITAILRATIGTLTIDPAVGGASSGSGSSLVWLAGTAAQVNAMLATLTYRGGAIATDSIAMLVLDATHNLTATSNTGLSVVPFSPANQAAISFDTGTMTLEQAALGNVSITLREPAGRIVATSLILVDTSFGPDSALYAIDSNDAVTPRIAVAGRVDLQGHAGFSGGQTSVTLAQGAVLTNGGTIDAAGGALAVRGSGQLQNDGFITIEAGARPAPAVITTALSGSGTLSLLAGAELELDGPVAANQHVAFSGAPATLRLGHVGSFAAEIDGFGAGDTIMLDGATVTTAICSVRAGISTLELFAGDAAVGSLRFAAPEAGTVFKLGATADGTPTISLGRSAASEANLDVYRFFDAANGTQLLTNDATERDAILGSRPDLRYEGVGLKSFDPDAGQANLAPVYRFFDSGNGTHFMTASAGERDQLLASRPDLMFEPGSTIFEHATQAAGDVAVYRFFDRSTGAHFFTADAGERAGLLASRPDLAIEGIAFYAPSA